MPRMNEIRLAFKGIEGGRATSTAELVAGKSKSHAERAQKNSVIVSHRSPAQGRTSPEHVSAFAEKNTAPGMLLSKNGNQKDDNSLYDGTEQQQKIENTATKKSQNKPVAIEEEKDETGAVKFASGSCTPLQLMQGERRDSGYTSIHAYGDKKIEGKGHDVDHFSEGNELPITRRQHKLQNKAKPILAKLIPSLNVDFDVGPATLLFDKTSDIDGSQQRKAKAAIDDDNRAEYLKNLPSETGKCLLNTETDSVPSLADTCSSSDQVSKLPNPVQYQTNLEDQISIGHPRVHRRRKSDSSLLTSIVWNSAHATDPLECLHVKISLPWLPHPFAATFVYAKCTRQERLELWNCLRYLSLDMQGPWMVGGDFNTIVSCAERLNGAPPHGGSMEDFATTLLDCGLTDAALQKILVFLQEYEAVSGQQVNHQKSCFITSNGCPMTRRQIIAHTTGFQHKTLPVTYLGAPLHKGPRKVALFDSLITKIRDRISGWENKTLSPGGGLDIRRLNDVSDAFTMKLWWRFQTCDGLWTNFLKTKYCMGQIPHYVQSKLHDSQVWKRMVRGRDVAIQNTRWRIGKGNLFFWHDCWMGNKPLVTSFPSFRNDMTFVHKFYNGDNWDVNTLKLYLPMNLIDEILQIPFDRSQDDIAYWALTSDGEFSTWSAWEAVRQRQSPNTLCSFIWHKSIPLTISFFLWRVLNNWIPVELRLKEKGFHLASKCVCCNSEESLIHVLWDNPVAKQVWNFFADFFQINISNPQHVSQIIWAWYYSGDFVRKGHIRTLIPLFICWFLWLERNDAKHRHLGMYSDRVVWKIMKVLRQLQDGSLLKKWQWKGDTDIAAMWGFTLPLKIRESPQIIHWVKPVTGEYKLNVDGSSRHNQSAATGGLLRDHTGTLVFGFSENIGPSNSLQAELRALLRGLLLCKDRNIEKLWIEMDALVVIQMIQQSKKGSHDIRYLLASIRKCLSFFSFRISHIFREGNQAADFLSNKGHTHQNLQVISEAQGKLHGMLKLDRLNLPYVKFH
ncbi:Uncharacterized protein TCM_042327 [Theobroma cacao]|uniref:RNase H type-1 domain-containing protein n=1 Tax=Theobroma cacao TaxID=3641 RepID=A0A061GZ95_THECC|nr:Uncharacterized protein TCM_042327 [Theobroma cacao]